MNNKRTLVNLYRDIVLVTGVRIFLPTTTRKSWSICKPFLMDFLHTTERNIFLLFPSYSSPLNTLRRERDKMLNAKSPFLYLEFFYKLFLPFYSILVIEYLSLEMRIIVLKENFVHFSLLRTVFPISNSDKTNFQLYY